jgi:hypothetical protein
MDPSRLVDTTWVGLERELLRSARDEVTPDAVRARVHQSVATVLASSPPLPAALPVNAATAGPAAACEAVPSPNSYRGRSGSGGRSAPAKLALALRSVHAVYLRLVRISSPAG